MAEKVDACWSCRFYKPFESGQGACRRHAPMLIELDPVRTHPYDPSVTSRNWQSAWPMIGRDEWCGDFEVRRAPAG